MLHLWQFGSSVLQWLRRLRAYHVQRMQRVMRVLDEIIRPRLQQDGGDIELLDIEGKTVRKVIVVPGKLVNVVAN